MMDAKYRIELDAFLAGLHPNLKAWGEMLKIAEGTKTNPLTVDDGHDVIVNGIDANNHVVYEVFTDYSHHPFCGDPPRKAKVINRLGESSTASGAFQLLARYWPPYKLQLRLNNFGPTSQWNVMLQQVKECHALDDIRTGHLRIAVGKCSHIWASLPGNSYGQHQEQLSALEEMFDRAGGNFA